MGAYGIVGDLHEDIQGTVVPFDERFSRRVGIIALLYGRNIERGSISVGGIFFAVHQNFLPFTEAGRIKDLAGIVVFIRNHLEDKFSGGCIFSAVFISDLQIEGILQREIFADCNGRSERSGIACGFQLNRSCKGRTFKLYVFGLFLHRSEQIYFIVLPKRLDAVSADFKARRILIEYVVRIVFGNFKIFSNSFHGNGSPLLLIVCQQSDIGELFGASVHIGVNCLHHDGGTFSDVILIPDSHADADFLPCVRAVFGGYVCIGKVDLIFYRVTRLREFRRSESSSRIFAFVGEPFEAGIAAVPESVIHGMFAARVDKPLSFHHGPRLAAVGAAPALRISGFSEGIVMK